MPPTWKRRSLATFFRFNHGCGLATRLRFSQRDPRGSDPRAAGLGSGSGDPSVPITICFRFFH